MVVVKIGDGLGNQMFNYVCGYAVAKKDGDTLLLDTSDVDNSDFRTYALDKFNIDYTARESFGNKTVLHKIYKRLRRNLKYNVIFERRDEEFPEDMNVYRSKGIRNKYLHGYFQNLCYFNSCKEDILRQFTLREELSEEVRRLSDEFSGSATCSLHIRGGDIPPLPVGYYVKAVKSCIDEASDVKFIVFSNVREIAEKYMGQIGNAEFIWNYGNFSDTDELMLMKACRFHILSDSTFSRWGALLDEKKGAVYAPYSEAADKIYLPEWIRIRS